MEFFTVLIQAIVLAFSLISTTSASPIAVPEPQQPSSTDTAPPSKSNPITESNPWVLTNIKKFEANSANGATYITFDFKDDNEGIQLKTTCSRVVLPGKGEIADGGSTVSCANPDVGFSYDGSSIKIQRSYTDPSVGPPGMDRVTYFGDNAITFTDNNNRCGKFSTRAQLLVKATSAIAK
ncbi:MAG: hypothetical protein M1831_005511 [Alyxoria varia]|nr:MAG: hypothetical protein M1831_005511 [Alyxoria varia]